MKKWTGLIFVCCFLSVSTLSYAEDDFQYWSRFALTPLKTDKLNYTNFWEMRVRDDASDLFLWYTSQRFRYTPTNFLALGLNYTYLQNEVNLPRGRGDEWKSQHRLELEVNPYWKFENNVQIKNRNRFEFRWIEDKGSDNGRFRQMWGLSLPIEKVKWVHSAYINSEYFVDLNRHSIIENRAVPLGLKFKINDHVYFQLFYMIQSQKSKGSWKSNQIAGTQWGWTV